MTCHITDKQLKILSLAVNGAAMEGEWHSAAVAFVRSIRQSGATLEALTKPTRSDQRPPTPPAPAAWSSPPGSMPFGKHKGKSMAKIPSDYLEWLLTCDLKPALARTVRAEMARRRAC